MKDVQDNTVTSTTTENEDERKKKEKKQRKQHHIPSKIIIVLLVIIILLMGTIALPVNNAVRAKQVENIVRTEVVKQIESSINNPPMSEVVEAAGIDAQALADQISAAVSDKVLGLVANDWKRLTDSALSDMEQSIRDTIWNDLVNYIDDSIFMQNQIEESNVSFVTDEGDGSGNSSYIQEGDTLVFNEEYKQVLTDLITDILSQMIEETILAEMYENFEITDQKIALLEEYINSNIEDINVQLTAQQEIINNLQNDITELKNTIPTLATKEEMYEVMTKIDGLTQELTIFKDSMKLEFDMMKELIASNYDELRAMIEQNAADIQTLYGLISDVTADYKAAIENLYNELNDKIEASSQYSEENLNKMYEDILNQIQNGSNDLYTYIDNYNTIINQDILNRYEQIYGTMDDTVDRVHDEIEKNKEQAADNLDSTDKKLTDAINESNKTQTDNLNEVNDKLTGDINDVSNQLHNEINNVSNTTSTIINNVDQKFTEQTNEITNKTESYFTQLDNKIYSQFNRTELSMTKNFMNIDKKFVTSLNNLTNYTNKYNVAVQNQTNKNINNWINGSGGSNVTHNYITGKDYDDSSLKGQLDQYNDLVQKGFNDLQNQIGNAMGGNVIANKTTVTLNSSNLMQGTDGKWYVQLGTDPNGEPVYFPPNGQGWIDRPADGTKVEVPNVSNIKVTGNNVSIGTLHQDSNGLWYVQIGIDANGNPKYYPEPGQGWETKDEIGDTVNVPSIGDVNIHEGTNIGDTYQDKDGNWYVVIGFDAEGKPVYQIVGQNQPAKDTYVTTNEFYFTTEVDGSKVQNPAPILTATVTDQPESAGQNRYVETNPHDSLQTGNLYVDTATNVWYIRVPNDPEEGVRIDIGLKKPNADDTVFYYIDGAGNGIYCGNDRSHLSVTYNQTLNKDGVTVNVQSPSVNKSYTQALQDTFTKLDNSIYTNFTSLSANLNGYMRNKLVTQMKTTDQKFTEVINSNNRTINKNIDDIIKKVTDNEVAMVNQSNANMKSYSEQLNTQINGLVAGYKTQLDTMSDKINTNTKNIAKQINGGINTKSTIDSTDVVRSKEGETHNITGTYVAGDEDKGTPNIIKLTSSVVGIPEVEFTSPKYTPPTFVSPRDNQTKTYPEWTDPKPPTVAALPAVEVDNVIPVLDKDGYPLYVDADGNSVERDKDTGTYPKGSTQAYVNLVLGFNENGELEPDYKPVMKDSSGNWVYSGTMNDDGTITGFSKTPEEEYTKQHVATTNTISDRLEPNNDDTGHTKYGNDGNPRSDFAVDLDTLKPADMPKWPGLAGIDVGGINVPEFSGDIIKPTTNEQGDASLVLKDKDGNPILSDGDHYLFTDGTNKVKDENGNDVLYNGKPVYSDGTNRVVDKDGNPIKADLENGTYGPTIKNPGAITEGEGDDKKPIGVPSFTTDAEGKRLYIGADGALYDNDGTKDVPRRAVTDAVGNILYYVKDGITDDQITDSTPKYTDGAESGSVPRTPAVKDGEPLYGLPVYEEVPRVDDDDLPIYKANEVVTVTSTDETYPEDVMDGDKVIHKKGDPVVKETYQPGDFITVNPDYDYSGKMTQVIDKYQKHEVTEALDKNGNVIPDQTVDSLVWDSYSSDEGNNADRNPYDMPDWNVEDWQMPSYGNATVTPGVGTVYDYYDEDAVYKEDVYSDTEKYTDNVYDADGNLIHKKGDYVLLHHKGDKLTTEDAEKHVNIKVDSDKDTIYNVDVSSDSYGIYPVDVYAAPTDVTVRKWADDGYDATGEQLYRKGDIAGIDIASKYPWDVYNKSGKKIHAINQTIRFITSTTQTPSDVILHYKGDRIVGTTRFDHEGYDINGNQLFKSGDVISPSEFVKKSENKFFYRVDIYNAKGSLIHKKDSEALGVGEFALDERITKWDHNGYDVNGNQLYAIGDTIGEFSVKKTTYETYTTTTGSMSDNLNGEMYVWVDEYGQINYSFSLPEKIGENFYDKDGNIIGVAGKIFPNTVYDEDLKALFMAGETIPDVNNDGRWDRDYYDMDGKLLYKNNALINVAS